ncbi:MAG: ubiquinol oxidase subunit II [Candidatus Makana argininalis]
MKIIKFIYTILMFIFFMCISGCKEIVIMSPKGQIGIEQRNLIVLTSTLMLLLIIPIIIITLVFILKYKSSNLNSKYNPNWCYSKKIEFFIWIIPIMIVSFLSYITWNSTHKLDQKKKIISKYKSINIQVISMDWKWLFIYPKNNIATINEIVFPVNIPIKFEITSNSVMNSFFIPQLGSQMYAMSGMNSVLNLISNKPGNYKGISSNFSGKGFYGMKFKVIVTPDKYNFLKWIKKVKSSFNIIQNIKDYENISYPSEKNKVQYFSFVMPKLYQYVIEKFHQKK